jgi:sensor histidine kinase YesM
VIQPLVENAIKHGISECLNGGEVRISVRVPQTDDSPQVPSCVLISVTDTGIGVTQTVLARRRARGLGLSNVEQRLQRYSGGTTPLAIQSAPGIGTTVEIRVPLQEREIGKIIASVKSS